MMFLIPIKVSDVYKHKKLNAVWPLWLLFCLTVTTVYGIILALRATEYAADGVGLSRRSTIVSRRAENEVWTLFKDVPEMPMPPAIVDGSARRTRVKWAVQRKANRAARRLQSILRAPVVRNVLRSVNAAVGFLLPPRRNEGEVTKDYCARRRIWIGNALATFCVFSFMAGELFVSLECACVVEMKLIYGARICT